MKFQDLWIMQKDPEISYEFGRTLLADATLGLCNSREFLLGECDLRDSRRTFVDDIPLPPGFVTPLLALPELSFSPDFLSYGSYDFASRRLRDAMAQPYEVVQFVPIDLVRGSSAAHGQDYRMLRVLARQSAMDLARSDCELEDWNNWVTGKVEQRSGWIDRFVLLDELQPRTEVFRVHESPTYIFASDALAERVLRAGCTGIEFSDPAHMFGAMRVERLRTATGVAERRVGFLD